MHTHLLQRIFTILTEVHKSKYVIQYISYNKYFSFIRTSSTNLSFTWSKQSEFLCFCCFSKWQYALLVTFSLLRRLLITFDVDTKWYVLALLCGYEVFNKSNEKKYFCRNYLKELHSLIESPVSMIDNVRPLLKMALVFLENI